MKILSIILVVLAFLVLVSGMTTATSAPQETVWVAMACFFGIMARIAQASGQHNEIIKEQKALKIHKKEE